LVRVQVGLLLELLVLMEELLLLVELHEVQVGL
jgi:hypothetical protein